MSDTTNALLQQAYALIENDELEGAQEILAPLLQDDANNAHLWWVYTHAVRDVAIGQAALERVLELDPKYPGARELKADVLEAQSNDPDLIALEAREANAENDFDVDDWENVRPSVDSGADSSSSRLRVALLAILLLVIAGGAFVISGEVDINELLSSILPSPEPQVIVVSEGTVEPVEDEGGFAAGPARATSDPAGAATSQRVAAGLEATTGATTDGEASAVSRLTPVATRIIITQPPPATVTSEEAVFVGLVADAIEAFEFNQARSSSRSTILGHTLVIEACAVPGRDFNARLNIVLTAAVAVADNLPAGVEAVAAGLLNCDDPQARLRVIGVTRGILMAYAAEEIEAKDFQRAWQPLS